MFRAFARFAWDADRPGDRAFKVAVFVILLPVMLIIAVLDALIDTK